MWFRKTKTLAESFRFPGQKHALDGHGAVFTVENMASEAILIRAVAELAEVTGPMRNLAPPGHETIFDQPVKVRQIENLRPLLGQLGGYAQVGLRAAGLTSSLNATHEALSSAAGKRLTYVVNLTCRALQRQAGALHGSHDDYYRVADAGCFQLFAQNAQETADLTLIAHRIAEFALTPGICAQDFYRTTHSVQTVRLPERGLVARYLGRPEDLIPCPTPAQVLLFGEQRRRIPVFVDRDRPAGVGGIQDHESYYRAVAAQRPFFIDHIGDIVDLAMRDFAKLTGRVYHKVSGYRIEDADVVVVAQGAVLDELEAVVDYLRSSEKIKAGVIALTMFRPFPGAEITRMLKGKRAVTILERTDQPLAEDLPITKEIRSAIAKAQENGMAAGEDDVPFPRYDGYQKPNDLPRIFSGAFGVGGLIPTFGDLAEVFRNMASKGSSKRNFYVGGLFNPPDRRFPHLESLQQRLDKVYPHLDALTVSEGRDKVAIDRPGYAIQLHSLAVQGAIFAGNLFAQTLANALNWTIKTFPEGGLEPTIQPVTFTILHAKEDEPLKNKPDILDMILVSGDRLIEDLPSRVRPKKHGTMIIESNRSPDDFWQSLSNRTIQWVREYDLQIYTIDSRKIASETGSRPSFVDQLAIWALLGGYLKVGELVSDDDLKTCLEHFSERLSHIFGASHYLIDDISNCVMRGTDELTSLDWKTLDKERRPVPTESEAPWTVQQVDQHDHTVFDVNRFWHSVGYLYNAGEQDETVTDPYLATGIMPAGSSAFRDMAPYRLRIPQWLPESCEACGLCWSVCPDSALPPTLQSIPALIQTAMKRCEQDGTQMVQMQRAAEHLAKQAYTLILKDELGRYQELGPLLNDAFSRLTEKMGLEGEKLEALKKEFEPIHQLVEHHPVSKTDRFFNTPHKDTKGSGGLLSIAHNPLSCTGCGLCIEVCPNDAYAWADQTPELLDKHRQIWDFQMSLPEVPSEEIEESISKEDPDENLYRLLDKTAYHSMVGGDAAFPGNTVKTAIHLVTATVESVMRPRFKAHVNRLDTLIEEIEERIQGKVARALQINDFERFGQQLTRVGRGGFSAESLARLIDDDGEKRDVDQDQLARLTGLLGQLKEQRHLYLEGGSGTGRARMAVTVDPGGTAFWSGTYPYNPHQHPWVSHLPGDAPALAEGVFEGITRRMVEEFKLCRQAELEAADSYDSYEHDEFFQNFDQTDLNDDEKNLLPPVIVITHSGSTNCEEIDRLLKSDNPIRVVIINTQAVTARNDDSGEPDTDLGQLAGVQAENSLGYLLLSQRDAYVLQTSVGNPGHLIQGVAEGLRQPHPALFHIFAPDPQTSGVAPERVIDQARVAYESRAFPLFKLDPDREDAMLSLDGNPDPDRNWSVHDIMIKDPAGYEKTIAPALTMADWAFREARFQRHFKIVPKGRLNDQMKQLAEYLEIDHADRTGYEPYIDVVDENQMHFLAIVSPALVDAAEDRLEFWNYLRELSETIVPEFRPDTDATTDAEYREPPPPPPKLDHTVKQRLTETLLHLCGYGQNPEFFGQTLGEFLKRNKQTTGTKETGDD